MTNGSKVTNEGLRIFLNRMFKEIPDYTAPSRFAVGIGTATSQATDTDLDIKVPMSGTESVDDCETANWTDSADMTSSLNSTTFKEGLNALNLTKDGASSTIAYVEKTTASLDFTDKELSVWIYIKDTATLNKLGSSEAIKINFGSDSSNNYEWITPKANLSVGWNLITKLTSNNPDVINGSPIITACDYTKITLLSVNSADTWVDGDIVMDDIKLASFDDFPKIFVSGYPILDETNLQVTFRCFLNTLEANGYDISEMGLFNTDSSPKIYSRAVFTPLNKSETVEISFVQKDKLV